jgi:predicted 3-demethylubiquinone-9 3-methyltransferase (glyoxalase superfamily)
VGEGAEQSEAGEGFSPRVQDPSSVADYVRATFSHRGRREEAHRPMNQKIKTFLMFEGRCEEAMSFYVSLFRDAAITGISRYGPGEAGAEGSVKQASFAIDGQTFMCIDSPMKHGFTFTPAMSLFVDCAGEAEIDQLFAKLSDGGQIFMPLDKYPFSRRFGWLSDKFGVSWQLNLAS